MSETPDRDELRDIAADCETAALFYAASPGLAGAETDMDLYRTIARLARAIAQPQKGNRMTDAPTTAADKARLLAALDDAIDLAETVIENEFSGTKQYAEWMEKVERLRAIQTQEQQS